jgi:hypothetical protein
MGMEVIKGEDVKVAIFFHPSFVADGPTRYGLIRPDRGQTSENFALLVAHYSREHLIRESGRSDWAPEERNPGRGLRVGLMFIQGLNLHSVGTPSHNL